jgi:transposase InsO family protein
VPGSFLQLDTIHFAHWQTKERYFVYTLIDLKSRWAYAAYSERISPADSVAFVAAAQKAAPFVFSLIQTDNGQEFGAQFEQKLTQRSITQRRIRLGRKNDNAHIERFNRTIQDECLGRWPAKAGIQKRLTAYLDFYNTKRLHLGLQCLTPVEVLQRF